MTARTVVRHASRKAGGSTPGSRVSTALTLCLLIPACSSSIGPEAARITLRVVSGDGQVGWEETALAQPIVVEAVDRDGAPVAGDSLRVAVSNGSGEVLDAPTVTDAQGRFQFQWELGKDFENTAVVSSTTEARAQVTVHATARYAYAVPEDVSDGWPTASLESVGMDSALLAELIDSVRSGHYPEVHSVVIVKDGQLVLEEYFPGHDFGYTNPFACLWGAFDRDGRLLILREHYQSKLALSLHAQLIREIDAGPTASSIATRGTTPTPPRRASRRPWLAWP